MERIASCQAGGLCVCESAIVGTQKLLSEQCAQPLRLADAQTPDGTPPCVWFRNDSYFRHERRWRGAGVAVPVFSLRTEQSVGCGEFLDLIQLGDFCHQAGAKGESLLGVFKNRGPIAGSRAHRAHRAHPVGRTPKCAGFCLVQLLPVNDTRVLGDWRDSYPYSSLCVFALHPIYLCLEAIGATKGGVG